MPILGPSELLVRIEDGIGTEDGTHIAFTVVTKDDKKHPFWMTQSDLPKLLDYLLSLSQHAAAQSGRLQAPPNIVTTAPIEAVSVGVAPGRSAEEVLLTIHTGPMPLAFATTPNALASLRDNLNRVLVPIGAGPAVRT